MALSTIQYIDKKEVHFTLANKPELLCKLDYKDYYSLIDGSNRYFVKICKHKRKNPSMAIARNERNGKSCDTYFLHWDLVGKKYPAGCGKVIDHKDRDPLNNKRENIREATVSQNLRNARDNHVFKCGFVVPLEFTVAYVKKRNIFQVYHRADGKSTYVCGYKSESKLVKKILNYQSKLNKENK